MSEKEKNGGYTANRDQEKSPIEFSDVLKGIIKFWFVPLILGVVVCAVMFFVSYSSFRPVYSSTATFTVNTQTMSLSGEGLPSYSYIYDNATASNLADTFPYILSSNILTEAICDDLDIPYVPVSLSANAVSSTNMFTLKAVGSDPQMTYDVLNSAMKNYPEAAKYLVGNVRLTVIAEPQIPAEPDNRFSMRVLLKGFTIGFLLGAAWILIYAFFRNTVKTKSDVKEKLKLDVIGVLPEVTFKKYKKLDIDRTVNIRNERVGKGFLEAVRVLKNSFVHTVGEDEKVIMSTSTAPGEGKTTAIVNLAISLADMGKKVLLVDCDLRNPSVEYTLFPERAEKDAGAEENEPADESEENAEENTEDNTEENAEDNTEENSEENTEEKPEDGENGGASAEKADDKDEESAAGGEDEETPDEAANDADGEDSAESAPEETPDESAPADDDSEDADADIQAGDSAEPEEESGELYHTEHSSRYGLSVLTFNSDNRNYWKIISAENLKEMFNSLREDYDYILVDTPPCGLVSDSLVVAQACDAIVYVVLQDTVRVSRILSTLDSLNHTQARVAGVIINGAASGLIGYGDNYGYGYTGNSRYKSYSRYGYGYGYGYGYSDKKNSGKKNRKKR